MTTSPTTAKDCILCGRCLSVCPVLLSTGCEELSPRAKHHLLKTLAASPERLRLADCRVLADKCLSCGRCAAACPQGLSIPRRLAQLRAQHPGWQQWMWKQWIERGAALWPMLATFGKILPDSTGPQAISHLVDSLRAMAPAHVGEPWLHVDQYDRSEGEGQTVLLFSGCTARRVQKLWRATALTILHGLGFSVLPEADMTCCGLTLDHAGVLSAARSARQRNVDAWRAAGRPRITTFCATCYHGLADYAQQDGIQWEPGEAESFTASLVPLSLLWGKTTFRISDNAPAVLRYHQPCHWNGKDPDRLWLAATLGARFSSPSGVQCCGMGGVLQLGNQPLSRTVSDRCWDALIPSPPEPFPVSSPESDSTKAPLADTPMSPAAHSPAWAVVSGCSGCVLQLRASQPRSEDVSAAPVGHWLDAIAPQPDAPVPPSVTTV